MILGIDTSCYTTSLAVVDENLNLLGDCRRLLDIEQGKRGMAQSEMFFAHCNRLPQLLEALFENVEPKKLKGVAVSVRPRPQENSYMPVFRAGENMARVIAKSLGIPLFFTSHQEGHLQAAIWSCREEQSQADPKENQTTKLQKKQLKNEFLAVHLSGGTSELLRVSKKEGGFEVEILASADLAAGQFIDRIGVALGLPFPCGPHLEKLAQNSASGISLPVSVKVGQFYFSGPYTAAQRLLEKGADASDLAEAVFNCIATTISRAIAKAMAETGLNQVVFCGGVICNSLIRNQLCEVLSPKGELFFANSKYSGDNSIGVALLGLSLIK